MSSLTAVSPDRGLVAGGTSVTNGNDFANVIRATIGGGEFDSRTVVRDTQIIGITPAATSPGARDVAVTSSEAPSDVTRQPAPRGE